MPESQAPTMSEATQELAFANNRKDAERLADELGGRIVRVTDRRGWIVVPND